MSGLEAHSVGGEDGRDSHDDGTSVLTGMVLLLVVMVMGVVMAMVGVGW